MSRVPAGFVVLLMAIAVPPAALGAVVTTNDNGPGVIQASASGKLMRQGQRQHLYGWHDHHLRHAASGKWRLGDCQRHDFFFPCSHRHPPVQAPARLRRRRYPPARSFTSSRKGRAWATACGACLVPARKRCSRQSATSTASPRSPARRSGSPGRRPRAPTRARSSPSIGRPFHGAGSTPPITRSCPAIAWSSARTR